MTPKAARTDRRIVVGVDGSGHCEIALRWALRQAGLTGATTQAVIAWQYPMVFGFSTAYAPAQAEILPELTRQTLDKTIAAVIGEQEPSTELVRLVVQGHAAEVLVHTAEDADLLVLGTHGHGALTGMLLGSVTQYCVHHATCPVVVVPDSAARRRERK